MTTHLKSRNGSWNLDDLKTKNLYFSKPLFEILQDKDGRTFIRENGKKVRSKIDIVDLIDKETSSGRFACGYFSYEYNSKGMKPPKYNAIFNIYEGFSPCGKNKISYQTSKSILKKITPNSSFISGVKKAQKYIKDGDIYQINLTREFTLGKIKSPYELFLNYYQTQPVDFGSFFEFHDHSIVSGSMELFIKKSGKNITTKPIKGTASINSADDKNLKKNNKEISENLMIVDLMRNDLSQICVPGSVKTNKLFKKKSYSTLVQLESEIEGILVKKISNKEIFKSLMPPGSVTGTPKSRAKEIIHEIERHKRGPYCGALGFFGPSGDFCFSVGIRLVIIEKSDSRFYTGAGIVWDSKPIKENTETILKSQALSESLEIK